MVKGAVVGLAFAVSAQPCLAATSPHSGPASAVAVASTVEFDLQSHVQSAAVQKTQSMTAAISASSAITAQEAEQQQQRRGMSTGAKTALIIGGVAILAVIGLAVLAASSVPPSF
jgi:CHASE3 domain sensor protein